MLWFTCYCKDTHKVLNPHKGENYCCRVRYTEYKRKAGERFLQNMTVFVYITVTKAHRTGNLQTTEICFSQLWMLRSPRSRHRYDGCLVRAGLCWDRVLSLCCPEGRNAMHSHGRRHRKVWVLPSTSSTNHIYEGSTFPVTSAQSPCKGFNTVRLGIKYLHDYWKGYHSKNSGEHWPEYEWGMQGYKSTLGRKQETRPKPQV